MENIIKAGPNTIIAHLNHLKDHGEMKYYNEAIEFLKEKNIEVNLEKTECACNHQPHTTCPGSQVIDFSEKKQSNETETGSRSSHLKQWPVQLTLIPPNASYLQGKDLLLVADCVGYSLGDFHKDYLKEKSLAIACPKLDSNLDVYVEKLVRIIDTAKIDTLTVMTMEVPCCGGLVRLAAEAVSRASRKVPVKNVVVGVRGDVLSENWI